MTTSTHTGSEKRYNEIAFNWLIGTEPDSTATNDLRIIAQTCLADGGRAVLDSRGICAVWLKEYYDEGNCNNLQPRSGNEGATVMAKENPILNIVPNPADDLVRVTWNVPIAEGEQLQVQVFNLSGQKVHTATMTLANEALPISVKGWSEGLYVARVTAHNKTYSKTFVVQRR